MIFEIIMTILVSLIEFLMLILFINVSNKNKIKSILIIIFYFICFNIINIFISNKIISLLVYFIIKYIHIFHNLKCWKKNLLNISLYNIFKITGIAFVIFIISSLNSSQDINTLFNEEFLNIIIISNNLTLILLKFYLYKKRYELYEFNLFKILYFLLVSILCLFLSIIIYHISLYSNINNNLIYIILFILLFINFIILNILDSYYDNLIETTKDKIINRQIENERDYFVDLVSNYKISNKEVHDLKNKLYLIKDLINKDKEKALTLIDNICNIVDKPNQINYSNNYYINSLINSKLKNLENNKVFKYDIRIDKINDLNIEMLDILVILGNLLDNSIEHINQLDNGYLELSMIVNVNCLSIMVNNNTKDNISLLTSKENKLLHGIGLNSVKNLVKKYNGVINIDTNNNEFKVEILLLEKEG